MKLKLFQSFKAEIKVQINSVNQRMYLIAGYDMLQSCVEGALVLEEQDKSLGKKKECKNISEINRYLHVIKLNSNRFRDKMLDIIVKRFK